MTERASSDSAANDRAANDRASSERARSALRAIGMEEAPLSALERQDALFVLTPSTLVYQDGGGTRRVTLRDLTRIHSDQEGMLRVETPAGTALTASLLGFDPGQVQGFFAQVRTTTYDAKQLPSAPLPGGGPGKTFAPAPATDPAPTPVPAPVPAPQVAPPPPSPPAEALKAAPQSPPPSRPAEAQPTPAAPAPASEKPGPTPTPPPPARPVVISSSAFSPNAPRPAATPEVAKPVPAPVAPTPPAPEVTGPPVPAARPSPTQGTLTPVGAMAAVARHADAVEALVGRLRLLGGVLFVAALALAYFQFSGGERLPGLWTLLAGGVGSIALLALADLARLLVALSRAFSSAGGVMDVD